MSIAVQSTFNPYKLYKSSGEFVASVAKLAMQSFRKPYYLTVEIRVCFPPQKISMAANFLATTLYRLYADHVKDE